MRKAVFFATLASSTLASALAFAQDPAAAAAAPGTPGAQPAPQQPMPSATVAQDKPAAKPAEAEPERKAHNSVFVELGGNGYIYSVNYERMFGDSDFSARIGFMYMSLGASAGNASASVSMVAVPALANYYLGGRNHKLHLGAGATFTYLSASGGSGGSIGSVNGFVPMPTAVVGYRYIPADGGFAFSVGFTPFIVPGGDRVVQPWGGMSFGGVF